MSLDYEKKSFELFDKLNVFEKYRVMFAEKSPQKSKALKFRLSAEEENHFWAIFDDHKKFAQNIKQVSLLSFLRDNLMRDILTLLIFLVEDNPFGKPDEELLEIIQRIKGCKDSFLRVSEEMLQLCEESELLKEKSPGCFDYPSLFLAAYGPDKTTFLANTFEELAEVKNPAKLIIQTKLMEAREVVKDDPFRSEFINILKQWLEVI